MRLAVAEKHIEVIIALPYGISTPFGNFAARVECVQNNKLEAALYRISVRVASAVNIFLGR